MKHKVYAIWDEVIGAYSSPMLATNKGHVIRMLTEWSKNPNHPLASHPKDKTLFEIGDYDDEKGFVENYVTGNKNMGGLHEFAQQIEGQQ